MKTGKNSFSRTRGESTSGDVCCDDGKSWERVCANKNPFKWEIMQSTNTILCSCTTVVKDRRTGNNGAEFLNAYTRVHQVPLDTDPLMWWNQHVQDLTHMVTQYLTVPATSVSPERLFRTVGGSYRVTSGYPSGHHLDWRDVGGLNKHPELNLQESKRNDTHTLTHWDLHTYHSVTDTHLSLSLNPPTYRSWLEHLIPSQAYRLSINYWRVNPLINQLLIRLSIDNRFIYKQPGVNQLLLIVTIIPLSTRCSTSSPNCTLHFFDEGYIK